MVKASRTSADTPERILAVAERLVQTRGFNGFSYADVASELGISKPSLHYHFAGKAEMGEALVARYAVRFFAALAEVDGGGVAAPRKLETYVRLYAGVIRDKRMCLCGMLAAEYETLPVRMREAVVRFLDDNERWLTAVLEQGRAEGTLRVGAPAEEMARMIMGALEGAMLVARPYGDDQRFAVAARRLLAGLVDGDARRA